MMMKSALSLLLTATPLLAAPLSVTELRTEHEPNPIGVRVDPRLSWQLAAAKGERGKRQTKFHLLASSSAEKLAKNEGDLWDFTKERAFQKHLIQWQGKPLKKDTTVHWKVKVWDEKNEEGAWSAPATFKVGETRQLRPIKSTSSFESSHQGLNQIFNKHKAGLETRLQNYVKGDKNALGFGTNVIRATREYLYHFDATAALWHWVDLIHQGQKASNFFPASPVSKSIGLGQSDAGILVPYGTWWMSGDALEIRESWKAMDNYMVAREQADQGFRGRIWGLAMGENAVSGPSTPRELIDISYLGQATRVMKDLAIPGGEPLTSIRYKDFGARIKKSFAKQYLTEDGTLTLDSQTAQLLALRSSVLPAEKRAPILASLKKSLEENGLQAGSNGTSALFPVLTFTGNLDLLFDLVADKHLADFTKKNSPTLGTGTTEWMMSTLAGIDTAAPGFQQIRIAPVIPTGDRLTHVSASHDSPAGKISVSWKKSSEGVFTLDCTIPPGALGIITLPQSADKTVTESGKSIKDAFGTQLVKKDSATGNTEILTQSGDFSFQVK